MRLWGKNMKSIAKRIKYLPATCDPLSADVYFIEGDKYCYVYDVGNGNHSLHRINEVEQEKIVILSHGHKDHIGNIDYIKYRNLYVGKKTYEIIGKGRIVEDVITIHDGVQIEIIYCISPHAEGSLILNVDNEYALIADLYFTRPPFDREKAIKMIDILKSINTKYFVISHQEDEKVVPKNELVAELLDYFNQ